MQKMQGDDPIWSAPVRSISPIEVASKVSTSVQVRLFVGGDDQVAPADLSQHYADVLRHYDKNVTVAIVPHLEHDILLEPVALDTLKALARSVKNDARR